LEDKDALIREMGQIETVSLYFHVQFQGFGPEI